MGSSDLIIPPLRKSVCTDPVLRLSQGGRSRKKIVVLEERDHFIPSLSGMYSCSGLMLKNEVALKFLNYEIVLLLFL